MKLNRIGRPTAVSNPITIDPVTSCWVWSGNTDAYGHPIASEKGRIVRVRQIHFEKEYGRYPNRVFNTCLNALCVNPKHMIEKIKDTKVSYKMEANLKIKALQDVISSPGITAELKAHLNLEIKRIKDGSL